MRRTTELAVRTEARKQPAFAAEMGAGFPPFFPPLDEKDSAFTVLFLSDTSAVVVGDFATP